MFAPKRYDGYRELFLRHPQPMWVYEIASLRFLDVNDAACEAYGYTREQFLDMTTSEIRPAEDRRLRFELAHALQADSPTMPTLWRHRRADGSIFYADVMSQTIDFDGIPARIVLAIDATARLAVSRALSESRAALAEAQELAHLGSFDTDIERNETRWSAELYRVMGVDPAQERPGLLYEFDHPDDRAAVIAEVERAWAERTPYTIEHRIRTRDGRERVVFERGRFFYRDGASSAHRAVGAILDVTERKLAEERLRELAEHDALTGLPNRVLLASRLVDAIKRAKAADRMLGVLFLDLDRFKTINDTIAHAAGDRLLRELAVRLLDRVGGSGTVGRPGGDEFIIMLEDIESIAAGLALAHRLLAAVAEPLSYEDKQLVVTASIGFALYPSDGATPDDLLRSADTAMYAAKAAGGNAVEMYSPLMHARTLADAELERALRAALEGNRIGVHYQPIVDANTGAVVALEALARWSENGQFIAPSDFIPLAEKTGLIVRLGTFVLEQACRTAAALDIAGHTDLSMSVNISASQFRETDFAGRVARALVLGGLDASRLQLEITESAYISADSGVRNVRALADLGVHLSIDDFGTGYSSLGYLKRLPVDALKVDRSFVEEIVTDAADQAIIRAIIAVARNLGLGVIGEGVETAEQAAMLRILGCDRLQGFYFSRPVPPEKLEETLRKLS